MVLQRKTCHRKGHPTGYHVNPDRIQIAFDDPRLVANAGLILPVTLAGRLGLSLTQVGDMAEPRIRWLARRRRVACGQDLLVLGCVVKAPSTLGTAADAGPGDARAWDAGAGPEDSDRHNDSSGETYGRWLEPAGLSPEPQEPETC